MISLAWGGCGGGGGGGGNDDEGPDWSSGNRMGVK